MNVHRLVGCFALLAVLVACCVCGADAITVTAPSFTIAPGATEVKTVTAQISGSFDIASYNLNLKLVPRVGASGLSFNGAEMAASNYLFNPAGSFSQGVSIDTASTLYRTGDVSVAQTIANQSRNLVDITFLGAPLAAGVYDLQFEPGELTAINDGNGDPIANVNFVPGTVNVVPEPSTWAILSVAVIAGGVGLLRRRWLRVSRGA